MTKYLLWHLLLSSPVFSKPISSTKFPTLGRPFIGTGTALNATTLTPPSFPPHGGSLPSKAEGATAGINGMNIFWIIVPLLLACMTHPLGSAFGFDQIHRYQIRIGPLVPLLDALHLLYEIHHHYRTASRGRGIRRIYNAIGEVVEIRLQRNRKNEQDGDGDPLGSSRIATLLRLVEIFVYNTLIRYIFAAMLILQYVKLCGFHGIPISLSQATGYFASWFILEMTLLLGQAHAAMEPDQTTSLDSDSISLPAIPQSVVEGVFLLQPLTIGFVAVIAIAGWHGHMYEARVRGSHMLWVISLALTSFPAFVEEDIYHSRAINVARSPPSSGRYSMIACNGFFLLAFSFGVFFTLIAPILLGSWYPIVHLPYYSYSLVLYSSRLFFMWVGEEGKEWYRAMARPRPGWGLSYSTVTYAGGLLVFYISVFSPEGTWKASWTEYLP